MGVCAEGCAGTPALAAAAGPVAGCVVGGAAGTALGLAVGWAYGDIAGWTCGVVFGLAVAIIAGSAVASAATLAPSFLDRLDPSNRIMCGLFLLAICWLSVGTLFFYGFQPDFDDIRNPFVYSFYFCVNAGLGVGNVPVKPTRWFTRIFAAGHCLVGNALIVGGICVYYSVHSDLVVKRMALTPDGEEKIRRRNMLWHLFGFLGLVAAGATIA